MHKKISLNKKVCTSFNISLFLLIISLELVYRHISDIRVVFFRDHVVLVTFSCAVTGIIVRTQNDVCQIVVEKKKKEIVGEQLLPLCNIVYSKLKPFTGNVCSFDDDHKIPERLLPLDSDKEVNEILSNDPDKAKTFEGTQALTHLRLLLKTITDLDNNVDVSII